MRTDPSNAPLLRVSEAAELAGLSTRAIYRAIERGELHAARLCSRLRIPRAAFDEWIERSTGQPAQLAATPPPPPMATGSFPGAARTARGARAVSIERIEREGGVVWRVRWREGRRNRSKVLGRKRDAEAFDAELKRRRRTGEIAHLDAGKETLAQFGENWWRLYAEPNLAATTLQVYAAMWDAYVLPQLGALSLRDLTPTVINRFRLELEAAGVGRSAIAKTLTLLPQRTRMPGGVGGARASLASTRFDAAAGGNPGPVGHAARSPAASRRPYKAWKAAVARVRPRLVAGVSW